MVITDHTARSGNGRFEGNSRKAQKGGRDCAKSNVKEGKDASRYVFHSHHMDVIAKRPEVLERAKKAESQAATLSSNQRELEQSSKRSLAEMSTQLAEAQRDKARAESECNALKSSVGSMKESWAREVKVLRGEMRKADDGWKQERDEVLEKNTALLKLVQDHSSVASP